MAKKRKVLFVDKKNDLQSQIAEYFLKRDHGDFFEAYSASDEWDIVDCDLLSVMLSMGHDIRRHFSKHFDALPKIEFDYLVAFGELGEMTLKRAPKFDKLIVCKIAGSESFQASDDRELEECYISLVNRIHEWVDETFASYASADQASE